MKLKLLVIIVGLGVAVFGLKQEAIASHVPCGESFTGSILFEIRQIAQTPGGIDLPDYKEKCVQQQYNSSSDAWFGNMWPQQLDYTIPSSQTTFSTDVYYAMWIANRSCGFNVTSTRTRIMDSGVSWEGSATINATGVVGFPDGNGWDLGAIACGNSKGVRHQITVDLTKLRPGQNTIVLEHRTGIIPGAGWGCGTCSDDSATIFHITITTPPAQPPPPVLTTGCNGATPTVTVNWNDGGSQGSSGYRVEIDNDNDWGNGGWSRNFAAGIVSSGAVSSFAGAFGGASGALNISGGGLYWVRVYYLASGNYSQSPDPMIIADNTCVSAAQGVQGKVFIDGNGSGSYESGEPIVQNPAGSCGGYTNVAGVTVSAGAVGNLNVCGPEPGYRIDTAAGNQTVSVNLPAGWMVTNGATRSVNVASGVYYSVFPWFGIRPTLAIPSPSCPAGNSIASVTINPAGLSVNNYYIDISSGSGFVPANTSNRLFASAGVIPDVPNGFTASSAVPLVAGTTYYVRVYYNGPNVHSETQSFVAMSCGPLPTQGVQGKVFIDGNANGSFEVGEPIVQSPSGACGAGYTTVIGISVSAGSTSNLNDCTPDPGYKISTGTGSQTVTINSPAGWTVTNGSTRIVNVVSGSYYNVFPWFGIRPTLAVPVPSCTGTTSTASVTINSAGLSVNNYFIDISTASNFSRSATSNRSFPRDTTTVTDVPNGFTASSAVPLVPGTTYHVRVYYNGPNIHSETQSFVALSCAGQGVQGKVFIDENGNGSYEAGEPIVQNPSGVCGGYVNVSATVSTGASSSSLNDCTPTPGYKLVTAAGFQTVTLNIPVGWVSTNGISRTVSVAFGSFYNATPWFGIKPTLAPPNPSCSGTTSIASVTINGAGLNVSNYFIDISDNNSFLPANTSNRSFPPGTTTVPDVPIGFTASTSIPLITGLTYYVRVYYSGPNVHSETKSFVAATCGSYDNVITSITADNYIPIAGSTVRINLVVYNQGNGSSPNTNINLDGGHVGSPGGPAANTTYMGGTGTYTGVYNAPPPSPASYQWSGPGLPPYSGAPFSGQVDWRIDPSVGPNVTICFVAIVTPGSGSGVLVFDPSHTGSVCVTTASVRTPYFTTTNSDIHAGGNSGINCIVPGAGRVKASSGTNVDYVISAIDSIDTSISGGLRFGSVAPIGQYGKACRPDLVALAEKYRGTYTAAPRFLNYDPVTAMSQLRGAIGVDTMVYWAGPGDLYLPNSASLGVLGRVTLYANGNVHIRKDINYASGAQAVSNLPGFGIIAAGDIAIDKDVVQLDGYYYAYNGKVDTCDGIPRVSIPANCNNPLTIRGLLMANSFNFTRSGTSGFIGSEQTEKFDYLGDLFISPPPVFKDAYSSEAVSPRFDGERGPLY